MKKVFLHHDLPTWWRKICTSFLALSWILGLLLGILAVSSASEMIVPMMRSAVSGSVSIPGLLAATLLPFLFSAYAVYYSEPWLLLIISVVKSFAFGFCAFGIYLAYGQSAWLVRFLFLFSDVFMMPVLYVYWLRHISGQVQPKVWVNASCVAAALVIGSIDYCLIAPFLVDIISS